MMSGDLSGDFKQLYPDTAERLSFLEKTVADLKDEVQGYKDLFAAAARNPMARQVLGMLGIRPDHVTGPFPRQDIPPGRRREG